MEEDLEGEDRERGVGGRTGDGLHFCNPGQVVSGEFAPPKPCSLLVHVRGEGGERIDEWKEREEQEEGEKREEK